jgi:hypothetical protein
MLTCVEQRFAEQMPRLMHQLIDQIEELTKDVKELKEQLKTAKSE